MRNYRVREVVDVGATLTVKHVWSLKFFEGELAVVEAGLHLNEQSDGEVVSVNAEELFVDEWLDVISDGRITADEGRDVEYGVIRTDLVSPCGG